MNAGDKIPNCARCGKPFPDRDASPAEMREMGVEGDPKDYGMILIIAAPEGYICFYCYEKQYPNSALRLDMWQSERYKP